MAAVKLFYAKLEDRQHYGGTLLDEFPLWLVGMNDEVRGPNVYLVGWENNEVCCAIQPFHCIISQSSLTAETPGFR